MITKFKIFEQNIIDIEILKDDKPKVFRNKLANINNIKKEIKYHQNGNRYNKNKQKFSERYIIKYTNYLHRKNGPAYQSWYENGKRFTEIYSILGKKHREDGPASQEWYSNGQIKYIMYFINDKCHREDGPAFKHFDKNGELINCGYYLDNEIYERGRWIEELKKMNSPYYEEEFLKYSTKKYNL